jgi:hypothetical protein
MRRNQMLGTILAVSLFVGCSTTGPFNREKLSLPTGPSYVGGRGIQLFPTSPKLLPNIKDAMSELNMHSIVQNEDPSGLIVLEGKTAAEVNIRTTVQTSGVNSTVSVKIGWFGDEPLTRALLDRIGLKQGKLPEQPNPNAATTDTDEKAAEKPKSQGIFSRDAVPDAVMLRDQVENGNMPAIAR